MSRNNGTSSVTLSETLDSENFHHGTSIVATTPIVNFFSPDDSRHACSVPVAIQWSTTFVDSTMGMTQWQCVVRVHLHETAGNGFVKAENSVL